MYNMKKYVLLTLIFYFLCIYILRAQTKSYATIIGRKEPMEVKDVFLTDEVLFRNSKIIKIQEVDGESTKVKNLYEIDVLPGKHKLLVEVYIGQPAWNIEFWDTVEIDAEANKIYYLDCSTVSVFVSDKPAVADFSDMDNSEYLKMYDGERRPEGEVARLNIKQLVISSSGIYAIDKMFYGLINGKKININLKGYYSSDAKLKGIEILPGVWNFIHMYKDSQNKDHYYTPMILNAKAGNSYDFKFDEVTVKTVWFYNKYKRAWFLIPHIAFPGWGFYIQNITGFEETLAELDKAIEMNPDNVENYYKRGLLNSEFHYFKEARKDFRQVNKLQDGYADTYYRLACAELQLANFTAAKKDFKKAMKTTPDNPLVYNGYGVLDYINSRKILNEKKDIIKSKKITSAVNYFNQAVLLDSLYDKAFLNMGYAYSLLKNHDVAIKNYDRCIALNPDNHGAYLNRALAKEELLLFDEALADLNKCIELDPYYYYTYYCRGDIYLRLSKYKEAMKEYKIALGIYPYHTLLLNKIGFTKYKTQNYREALKYFDDAINLNSDYAEAYNNRGLTYHSMGKYQDALKDFNKAIRINWYYAEAFINRGDTKKAMGLFTEASDDYKIASDLTKKSKKKN